MRGLRANDGFRDGFLDGDLHHLPLLKGCVIVLCGLDGLFELRELFFGDGDLEIGDGITGVNVIAVGARELFDLAVGEDANRNERARNFGVANGEGILEVLSVEGGGAERDGENDCGDERKLYIAGDLFGDVNGLRFASLLYNSDGLQRRIVCADDAASEG